MCIAEGGCTVILMDDLAASRNENRPTIPSSRRITKLKPIMLKYYLNRSGQIPTATHPFGKRESSRQLKPPDTIKKADFVLTPYIKSSNLRATYQIINTVVPYVLLWIVAVQAASSFDSPREMLRERILPASNRGDGKYIPQGGERRGNRQYC